MLAKKNRFQGRTTLGLVFRRGVVTRGRSVSARWLPSDKADLRAAIVVSRKISKSAVVRNRIRRRIYTFLEQHLAQLKTGDLVVTVFDTSLAEAPASELDKVLSDVLKRAGVLS